MRAICAALAALLLLAGQVAGEELSISPAIQETYVWCWVAVGQMVFEHYGVPNVNPAGDYQCGIVGLLAAGTWRHDCAFRCERCTVPAGSAQGVIHMIEEYPRRAAEVADEEVPRLRASHRASSLSRAAVEDEIDSGRPIIVGISPSGRPTMWATSEHVALIVGYDEDENSNFRVLVNDPYPFDSMNPYTAAGAYANGDGSYWIDIDDLRNRLQWRETILVRENGTIRPTPKGTECCYVAYGQRGSCLLPAPAPLREPCTCTFLNGAWIAGRVCEP